MSERDGASAPDRWAITGSLLSLHPAASRYTSTKASSGSFVIAWAPPATVRTGRLPASSRAHQLLESHPGIGSPFHLSHRCFHPQRPGTCPAFAIAFCQFHLVNLPNCRGSRSGTELLTAYVR